MDLAEGHVAALKYMESSDSSEDVDIFNLGTGQGYSVLDMLRAMEQVGLALIY